MPHKALLDAAKESKSLQEQAGYKNKQLPLFATEKRVGPITTTGFSTAGSEYARPSQNIYVTSIQSPKSPDQETRWDPYRGEISRDGRGKPGQVRPADVEKILQSPVSRSPVARYEVSVSSESNMDQTKRKKTTWAEKATRIKEMTSFDNGKPWKNGNLKSPSPISKDNQSMNSNFTATRDSSKGTIPESDSDNSLGLMSHSEDEGRVSPLSFREELYDRKRSGFSAQKDSLPDLGQSNGVSPGGSEVARDLLSPSYHRPSVSPISTAPPSIRPMKVTRKPVASQVSAISAVSELDTTSLSRVQDMRSSSANLQDTSSTSANSQNMSSSSANWRMASDLRTPVVINNDDTSSVETTRIHVDDSTQLSREPASRFSWTTVATATTYQQDSPPPSPPPISTLPQIDRKLWRTYQIDSPNTDPSTTQSPPTPPFSDNENTKTSLVESPRKALPTTPIQATSPGPMSHVDVLLMQDSEVGLRRRNIQKVIADLQRIDKASPLDVDWKTSKANKKKLEDCQMLLDDLVREQHEVGLAISRARRRAEKEEGGECGLWVRRVTG